MDLTSRMLDLLINVRRERNGAVADSMRYYGAHYGLNYGVSLPTIRAIARAVETDNSFAEFLYKQDVRELRLIALNIANTEQLTLLSAGFWANGLINSELAEELAHKFLSRSTALSEIFDVWCADDRVMLQYAAMLAASRSRYVSVDKAIGAIKSIIINNDNNRMLAHGAVALLASLVQNEENRSAVKALIDSLGSSTSATFIREEMAWRS